jgi:hypothetical protein
LGFQDSGVRSIRAGVLERASLGLDHAIQLVEGHAVPHGIIGRLPDDFVVLERLFAKDVSLTDFARSLGKVVLPEGVQTITRAFAS